MATGFLLVPGKDHRQGQVVDIQVEGIGQGDRNLNRRVGIVALAYIHQAGQTGDFSQVFVEEAELTAGQGQHDAVVGHLLHKFGVVRPSGLSSVAAAHQEEVANFALLHGIHNGIGYAQHRIVGKADVDRVERFFRLKSGQVQGFSESRPRSQECRLPALVDSSNGGTRPDPARTACRCRCRGGASDSWW